MAIWISELTGVPNSNRLSVDRALTLLESDLAKIIKEELQKDANAVAQWHKDVKRAKKLGIEL